ncbi:MAG TPA: hypothetical protein VKB80_10645, partial [Kofleriaceae bacterium]|nr:hypothetical protein [Kofleriaceae bacterium]
NSGDDNGGPDAGEPDAAVPQIVRTGTVAITETTLTNPPIVETDPPIQGAVVTISFIDNEAVTVPPVEGFDNPIGACQIFVYDVTAGQSEPATVDEGPITVTGTANGDFTCAFNADRGYVCQSADAVAAGGVAGNAAGATFDGPELPGDPRTSILSGLGATVNAGPINGSQMLLDGFGDKSLDGQTFAVINRPSNNTVLLATPGPVPDLIQNASGTATYTTFIGAGPIPNPFGYNFMTDASDVAIGFEGSKLVPAFNGSYTPDGEGFELVSDPTNNIFLPHEFPTALPASGPASFGCAAEGCGVAGAGGQVFATIINGRTTDGATPPADQDPLGVAMPDPVGSFATFTCGFAGMDQASITPEELEVILGTNPTRIQTTVVRAQVTLNATAASDSAETRIIVGHSQTGFTTVEAPPKLARPRN